jgi:hypothetical protein
MTPSAREIERDLDRLDTRDGGRTDRAEDWKAYISGEIAFAEYRERRAGEVSI